MKFVVKHKFGGVSLNQNLKNFVMHMAALEILTAISIYSSWATQIAAL